MSAIGREARLARREALANERLGRAALDDWTRVLERRRRDRLGAVAGLHAGDEHGRRADVGVLVGDQRLEQFGARRHAVPLHLENRARAIRGRGRRRARQLLELAGERRAHRRLGRARSPPSPSSTAAAAGGRRRECRSCPAAPASRRSSSLCRGRHCPALPPGREVDVAVGPDLEVRDRHRLAVHELGEIFTAAIASRRSASAPYRAGGRATSRLRTDCRRTSRDTRSSGTSRVRPAIRDACCARRE